ncbi:hypothetical protein ACFFMN_02940 [Planobispora siamensis]|uniref:Uncharacterized protein n=1 Tax=Planobispora siamensis TaxID=936338 RepID=A0A8J3SKM7_9ACTN|nr:hypothetical protein [Planobispora siamensis]GIH94632.1 hypothetical protein Psi01_52620 [Planobispora siamensis]
MTPQPRSGLVPGIVVGLLAAVLGAAAYGAIITVTELEIGYAAVGVGVLVGLGMMAVKPTSPVLPVLAALFSIAGAALGTFLGGVGLAVKASGGTLSYGDAVSLVAEVFPDAVKGEPKTLLFWVIAGVAGFFFVNKRVKAAREALAAPSHPQQEGAQPVDNFRPHNQA